jgi:hypothetical protein
MRKTHERFGVTSGWPMDNTLGKGHGSKPAPRSGAGPFQNANQT